MDCELQVHEKRSEADIGGEQQNYRGIIFAILARGKRAFQSVRFSFCPT